MNVTAIDSNCVITTFVLSFQLGKFLDKKIGMSLSR